jgi:hypothetical protein
MDTNVEFSDNKDFKHDSSLEDDFNYDNSNDEIGGAIEKYIKYKIPFSIEESFWCREEFLDILKSITSLETFYVSIEPSNVNPKLVNYFDRHCSISRKCIKDISVDEKLKLEVISCGKEYFHFISLLILLCDSMLSNVKTRTKVSGEWEDLPVQIVFDSVKDIIENSNCEFEAEIDYPENLIGYIKTVLIDNKSISCFACNGPETAFELGKIKKEI